MKHLGLILLVLISVCLGCRESAVAQTPRTCIGKPIAVPVGKQLICSANWVLTGPCDALDLVDRWIINGFPSVGSKIPAWEDQPITIIGAQLVQTMGGPHGWWMIGNNYVPDAMGFMSPATDKLGPWFFPTGTGMPFPAAADASPLDYFDVHGSCSGGGQVSLSLVLFYAPEGGPPPTTVDAGTWNDAEASSRNLNGNVAGYQSAGLRWKSPASGTSLYSVTVNPVTIGIAGNVHIEIWSDANGSPGARLAASRSWKVASAGETKFFFPIHPPITPNTTYWMVIAQEDATTSIDWETTANDGNFNSTRGNTITSFAGNGLPNSEQWRAKVLVAQ